VAGGIAAVLCVLLFALPLGLLIGAVILRGGVSYANKCLPSERDRYYDDDWDDYDRPKRRRRGGSAAIPEPGVGKAMGIVFVNFIIGFIISIPISIALGVGMGAGGAGKDDPAMSLIASLIQMPIGFLVAAGVRTMMLPTSFPRACLVVLFEYLIVLAICVIIGVPLAILLFAAR
jgi:hypothetical protein